MTHYEQNETKNNARRQLQPDKFTKITERKQYDRQPRRRTHTIGRRVSYLPKITGLREL